MQITTVRSAFVHTEVLERPTSPADRAGANGSRKDRVNAGTRIFLRAVVLKLLASLPIQTVVFVRMAGSGSTFAQKQFPGRTEEG